MPPNKGATITSRCPRTATMLQHETVAIVWQNRDDTGALALSPMRGK